MTAPYFCPQIDGLVSTLAVDYLPGSPSPVLTLADASALGTPTPSAPVRLAVLSPDGTAAGQFLAVGVQGNLVLVEVDAAAGYPDAALPAASQVYTALGAAALADIHAAIRAAIGAIDTIQLTPGPKGDKGDTGVQGVQGPKGDTGATGPQGATGPAGSGGTATPGGASGQLQLNNAGAFGGSLFYSDPAHNDLGVGVATAYAKVHIAADHGRPSILLSGTDSSADGPGGQGNTDLTGGVAITLTYNGVNNRQMTYFASEQFGNSAASGFRLILGGPLPIIDACNPNGTAFSAFILGQPGSPIAVGLPYGTTKADVKGQIHARSGTSGLPAAAFQANNGPFLALLDTAGNMLGGIGPAGEVLPATVAEGSAAAGSLFRSAATGKLAFKDASGIVHTLY